MDKKLSEKDVTPAVKSAVNAYLMARAYAETMRAQVEPYYKKALEIIQVYEDHTFGDRHKPTMKRIYDHNEMYLSQDEETCKEVYADVNFHLRKDGIKPDSMPDDHCPALVAEHLQLKTEWLLIESAAEMLGVDNPKEFNDQILCARNGLEKRKKFIDLVVRLMVNLPDFKNPLTGK